MYTEIKQNFKRVYSMIPFVNLRQWKPIKWEWAASAGVHPPGRRGRFLVSLPLELKHCMSTVISVTVIISLILRLEPSDGQCSWVARLGAREAIKDPWWSIAITIDEELRGGSLQLLIPVHSIAANVTAASSTGDGDFLSMVPRHWGWLSQYRLCPGSWKREDQIVICGQYWKK
jgi:hypothetical protein